MKEQSNGPLNDERRLHFARHCWIRRKQIHLCKDGKYRTWYDIFSILEGINLGKYASIKMKEKESKSQSK